MSERLRQYHVQAQAIEAPALPPGLYLVATPIGNLRDVTLRALETLAAADVIYCEDTRVTSKLLERYGIRNTLRPCHDHNEAHLAAKIVDEISAGRAIAFASDAGTPLISDPGYRLVQACVDQGVAVTSLPGASAVLTAVQLSGLATDSFLFLGFLPQKRAERVDFLQLHAAIAATLVAYESPHRLVETLVDVAETFPGRSVAMARELTKLHEEVLRGTAAQLAAQLSERVAIKGECVLVIAGAGKAVAAMNEDQIERIIADAAAALPASKAAAQVARLTGLSRDEAFHRILARKEKP